MPLRLRASSLCSAEQFAGQPLVIISVSWDSDEAKWKDYVAKNGMT